MDAKDAENDDVEEIAAADQLIKRTSSEELLTDENLRHVRATPNDCECEECSSVMPTMG